MAKQEKENITVLLNELIYKPPKEMYSNFGPCYITYERPELNVFIIYLTAVVDVLLTDPESGEEQKKMTSSLKVDRRLNPSDIANMSQITKFEKYLLGQLNVKLQSTEDTICSNGYATIDKDIKIYDFEVISLEDA